MIQFVELNGRFRAAFIMTLLLSGAASCVRMEIVPRQEPEAGAIVFAPKVETDNWLSVSPASASSVAAPPEYSLSELRDAQGRQRLYLHAFYHAADESAPPLPETRGAVVDNNNFADACGSFGVTAYAYRGKWADGGDRSIYISDKQTVRNNGTYAPYGAIDPDGVGRDGLPEFSYTVPDKIEDQKDLLAWWGTDYSRKSSGTAGADAVDIDFRHLCTPLHCGEIQDGRR